MKKIKFYNDNVIGKRTKATDKKYQLLYYFFVDHNSVEAIQLSLKELAIVQNGEQTFEDVFTEKYGVIPIGYSAGEFECDKDTAYFISDNEKTEASFEMPLQELIDLLKEWKAFLES